MAAYKRDQAMDNEIQLISDGDGLAVIGNAADIDQFLAKQGLDKLPTKDLELQRLGKISHYGALVMETGAVIANGSGRWVQITERSAQQISQFGLMTSKNSGLSLGVVQAGSGKIKGIVEFAHGPGSLLANPAILAGAAGIMTQVALQKQMEDITRYLREIDEKADDIIRGQKDAVLADILGVDLILGEALTVRDQVGRVSSVTWSKVQATSTTIARTQAYALRQLDAIADKLHTKCDAGGIADATREAESSVREWLEVLARCIQLQDALSVLELDRVLDASPEELDRHRLGLNTARRNRRELIARCSLRLLAEMDETVQRANSKVLFNPFKSPAAVESSNRVAAALHVFRERIGIDSKHDSYETRQWLDAATEARDKVLSATSKSIDAARQISAEATEKAAKSLWKERSSSSEPQPKSSIFSAAEHLGSSISDVAADAASSAASAVGFLASGAVGSLFGRKQELESPEEHSVCDKEQKSQPPNTDE